jgi:hypothetical protein
VKQTTESIGLGGLKASIYSIEFAPGTKEETQALVDSNGVQHILLNAKISSLV